MYFSSEKYRNRHKKDIKKRILKRVFVRIKVKDIFLKFFDLKFSYKNFCSIKHNKGLISEYFKYVLYYI